MMRYSKRILHRFHKATPAELVRMLNGAVDDTLLADIESLIDWRNYLAHSYLVARLTYSTARTDQPTALVPDVAHVLELMQLAMAYRDVTARISAAAADLAGAWRQSRPEKSDQPDVVSEVLSGWTRTLVYDEPPTFSRPGPADVT
jgi:hypothetical protein